MGTKRCGCASDTCGCQIIWGRGLDASGAGSVKNPMTVDGQGAPATLLAGSTDTIALTAPGLGTEHFPYVLTGTRTGDGLVPSVTRYTVPGAYTWAKPDFGTLLLLTVLGAGGGGGGGASTDAAEDWLGDGQVGDGGGAGVLLAGTFLLADLPDEVLVTVGRGGSRGTAGRFGVVSASRGAAGGDSRFGGLLAPGGIGGGVNAGADVVVGVKPLPPPGVGGQGGGYGGEGGLADSQYGGVGGDWSYGFYATFDNPFGGKGGEPTSPPVAAGGSGHEATGRLRARGGAGAGGAGSNTPGNGGTNGGNGATGSGGGGGGGGVGLSIGGAGGLGGPGLVQIVIQ